MKKYNYKVYFKLRSCNVLLRFQKKWSWCYFMPFLCKDTRRVRRIMHTLYDYFSSSSIKHIAYSSTDTLSVLTDNSFYKFPLSKTAEKRIESEYLGWLTMSEIEALKVLFLPSVEKKELFSEIPFLLMDKANPVIREQKMEAIQVIINKMHRGHLSNAKGFISNDMIHGCEIISNLIADAGEAYCRRLLNAWGKIDVVLGPVHGDFHCGNLMTYEDQFILVDTDRCKLNGVQLFDVMHVVIGEKIVPHKNWIECLKELSLEDFIELNMDGLLFVSVKEFNEICKGAYFLDRIGKDYTFSSHITNPSIKESVESVVRNSLFLNKG